MYKSVEELKAAFENVQQLVANSEEILNGALIKILEVDILIRKADDLAGNSGWDAEYFRSNVGSLPGKNVIEKTENLVALLRQEGPHKPNKRQDFPLRNPKHVFDAVTVDIIKPLLPKINEILAT